MSCAAENPNRRLRLSALGDRVAVTVDRADFDDLVTMVTSAPTWEKDRVQGVRVLLRAIGEGKVEAPGGHRRPLDVAARPRDPEDPGPARERRPAGGEAAPRGAHELPRPPPRGERRPARQRRPRAADRTWRSRCSPRRRPTRRRPSGSSTACASASGRCQEVANALADNLPAPKQPSGKSRRRRRKKRRKGDEAQAKGQPQNGRPGDGKGRPAKPAEQAPAAPVVQAAEKTA